MPEPANSAPAEPEVVRAPMLTPAIAADALAFLARTPIQGAEARAFLRVQAALEALAVSGGR